MITIIMQKESLVSEFYSQSYNYFKISVLKIWKFGSLFWTPELRRSGSQLWETWWYASSPIFFFGNGSVLIIYTVALWQSPSLFLLFLIQFLPDFSKTKYRFSCFLTTKLWIIVSFYSIMIYHTFSWFFLSG